MNKSIEHLTNKSRTELFSQNSEHFNLIIIGAGFSGLEVGVQQGKKQINKNKKILIIEQADYIGGRIRTVTEKHNGHKFQYEAGGARFNRNHKSLINVINYYIFIIT